MANATEKLIEELKLGSQHAQQEMLAMYGESVWRQVTMIVAQQEDAEEVYQDVFLKAFKAIGSYRPEQASLATWLGRIAYNESLNAVRKRKPPIVYVDDRDVDLESMQDETIATLQERDEQTIELIERALDFLPPAEQAIITMFYFDNQSIKDIAYITETNISTVCSKLSRTRKKLYRIIKKLYRIIKNIQR